MTIFFKTNFLDVLFDVFFEILLRWPMFTKKNVSSVHMRFVKFSNAGAFVSFASLVRFRTG